jgi:hypothetical protein
MSSKKAAGPVEEEIVCVKGFDKNLKCRGFQFEFGKTYVHEGAVEACESGFHAIFGHPLEVFSYYAPNGSRYALVRQSGKLSTHKDDGKVASAKITIDAELRIPDLVKRAWEWVWAQAKLEEGSTATGDCGAASATGDCGAASATGNRGAASATGYQGAASATGDYGAAMSVGYQGRAMGADGCALFLVYRDDDYKIIHAWAGIAGQGGIRPDVFYTLGADGKPVEVTP